MSDGKETTTKIVTPDYTIRVQKTHNKDDGFFEVGLREMDETTFVFAQKMIRQGKDLDAVKFILKELRVSGDDLTTMHWRYINSVGGPILEMVKPYEAELKKN